MKKLLVQHWLAKLVTLALAVVVWAVIKKSIETTALRSSPPPPASQYFDLSIDRNGQSSKK
jgi:hypothetical protein